MMGKPGRTRSIFRRILRAARFKVGKKKTVDAVIAVRPGGDAPANAFRKQKGQQMDLDSHFALATVQNEYIRHEPETPGSSSNSQQIPGSPPQFWSTPPKPLKRSSSVPGNPPELLSSLPMYDELPASRTLDDIHSESIPSSYSPVSVMNFSTSDDTLRKSGIPPSMHTKSIGDDRREGWRSNSFSPRSGDHCSRHMTKRNFESTKASEAFLALKKELEKNEFTKVSEVLKTAAASDESILTTSPSHEHNRESISRRPDETPLQGRFEIISNSPSMDSRNNSSQDSALEHILGIVSASHSESYDSSDGSSYSSFDMESIGDITMDSTTVKLIEMHKSYIKEAAMNHNQSVALKKSAMKTLSSYPILCSDDASVVTEERKKLSWFDDEEHINTPSTLRTDASVDDSFSSSKPSSPEHRHDMVKQYLIPLATRGLEKWFRKISCVANEDDIISLDTSTSQLPF